MIKIILMSLVIFVSGCSGAPKIETQYFVLTPAAPRDSAASQKSVDKKAKKVIVLEPVELADFLDQPGIVLQKDHHQIEVAHYHRWAEPLRRNLYRFIFETLAANNMEYSFQENSRSVNKMDPLRLHVQVNQFHGTSMGMANLSGRWALEDSKSNEVILSDAFHYESALQEDGHVELVSQLAILLEKLCSDIVDSIAELN